MKNRNSSAEKLVPIVKIKQFLLFVLFVSGLLACQNNQHTQEKITGKWYIEDVQAADTSDVLGSALLAYSMAKNNVEAMEFTKDHQYNIINRADSTIKQNKYELSENQTRIIVGKDTTWEIKELSRNKMTLKSQKNTKVFLKKK